MAQAIVWSGGKPYEYVDGSLQAVQTPQTYTMPDGTKFTYGPDGTPQPIAAGQSAAPSYQGSGQGVPQWLIDQNQGQAISGSDNLPLGGNTSWTVGNQVYSGTQWNGEGGAPWGSNTPGYYNYENTPALQLANQTGKISALNGSPYRTIDANGNVTGSGNWSNLTDSHSNRDDAIVTAIVGSIFGAAGVGALGGSAAGAAEGAGAGAASGATGAGVTGFGDAGLMYGGADAAAAGSLGGGASVAGGSALGAGAAGGVAAGAGGAGASSGGYGAGVTGFGDAGSMYGGVDAASAGSLGGGASVNGGAALGGTAAMGAGGAGGAGGGSGGTPPPANPYTSGTSGFGTGDYDWTKLVGPAASVVTGAIGANAAGKASDAQLQAAREAQALLAPWRTQGEWAVNRLGTMLGKDGTAAAQSAFTTDPGYQFRQSEGEKGLQRAASAAGGLGSGKFLKDAMNYNQGMASQEFTNSTNRLANLAGLGQTSANSSADYATQGGNAVAAGTVGRANALTNAFGQGYSMYQNQNQQDQNNALLRQMLGSRYAY